MGCDSAIRTLISHGDCKCNISDNFKDFFSSQDCFWLILSCFFHDQAENCLTDGCSGASVVLNERLFLVETRRDFWT